MASVQRMPFWVSKERKRVNSLWIVGGGGVDVTTAVKRASSVQDVERALGETLAVAEHGDDEDLNYEKTPQSVSDQYVPNRYAKTLEIVKKNGCYTLQEDGRTRTANGLTRDEQMLTDSIDQFKKFLYSNRDDLTTSVPHEMRMAFEERKGGSEAHLNYTIGPARLEYASQTINNDKANKTPVVSPVALRVRLEDGEIPPTQCKISVRTVVIQGFDPVNKLQTVVDHYSHDIGDVPIASVSDPTTSALILAYPVSVPMPLHCTLKSKRRMRQNIDAVRIAYRERAKELTAAVKTTANEIKDQNQAGFFSRLLSEIDRSKRGDDAAGSSEAGSSNDDSQKPTDDSFTQSSFPDITVDPMGFFRQVIVEFRTKMQDAASWGARTLLYLAARQNVAQARDDSSIDYFTYGNAGKSVFADLSIDLDAISTHVRQASVPAQGVSQSLYNKVIQRLAEVVSGIKQDGTQRIVYGGLAERPRELAEYLVGRKQIRDKSTFFEKSDRPGTIFAFARTKEELNSFDSRGLTKEAQSDYRIDTYIDIELLDPQFDDVIKMSIVPGLHAAMEAGRAVQTKGDNLKDDFDMLVDSYKRLVALENNSGMSDLFPGQLFEATDSFTETSTALDGKPGGQNFNDVDRETQPTRPSVFDVQQSVAVRLRRILLMPPIKDGEVKWDLLSGNWVLSKNRSNAGQFIGLQTLQLSDWRLLPIFSVNSNLMNSISEYLPETRSKYGTLDSVDYKAIYESNKAERNNRHTFTKLSDGTVARMLSQLVVPKYRTFGESMDVSTSAELLESVNDKFSLLQTIASAKQVRKVMDAQLKEFVIGERVASSLIGERQRLRFATLYSIESSSFPLGESQKNTIERTLKPVFSSSLKSTLPFPSMYPHSVARLVGLTLASDYQKADSLRFVTGYGDDEPSQSIPHAEAMEAFAAIIVDTLGSQNVSKLVAGQLSENALQKSKRRTRAASEMIEKVFLNENAAIMDGDDDLMWLIPDGSAALIALHYSGCWQYRWDRASMVQGRSVWTRQMKYFVRALAKVSTSKINPTQIPLLNLQSMWLSERRSLPSDSTALVAAVAQAAKTFTRVTNISSVLTGPLNLSDPNTPPSLDTRQFVRAKMLSYAVQDALLSHPVVWRLERAELGQMLSKTRDMIGDGPFVDAAPKAIPYDELKHAWACRRVYFDDGGDDNAFEQVLETTVPINADDGVTSIADTLSKCNLSQDDASYRFRCHYYVPLSCDSLPNMSNAYDARLALQLVSRERINTVIDATNDDTVLNAFLQLVTYETTSDVEPDRDFKIVVRAAYDADNRPENPLVISDTVSNDGDAQKHVLEMHIAPQVDDISQNLLTGVIREEGMIPVQSDISLSYVGAHGGLYALLGQLQNASEAGSDIPYSTTQIHEITHNARRTLVFAIDRLYHGILFARTVEDAGRDVTVSIDLERMDVSLSASSPGCPTTWPDYAPKMASQFGRAPLVPQLSNNASTESNTRMISIALVVALSLLPEDLVSGMSFVIRCRFRPEGLGTAIRNLFSEVTDALRKSGMVSMPIGELVACIVHECFAVN